MHRRYWLLCSALVLGAALVCVTLVRGRAVTPASRELTSRIEKLRPLHRPISEPGPNDWLANHQEPGQTFRQYVRTKPVTATGKRRVLYVQPLGEFTPTQRKIIELTADFLGRYFQLPVKIDKDLPLSLIPADARREHSTWGVRRILSTYVRDEVLRPRLPEDAAAYIAFTAHDLWPGDGWNFVFGQASPRHSAGVWSIARNGDPDEGNEAFLLCLRRTLKTAVHETGHMFSIRHCASYHCCMCGSNHQQESDRQPLELCPECLAKVCHATQCDAARRFRTLTEFCETQKLEEEAAFFRRSLAALESP